LGGSELHDRTAVLVRPSEDGAPRPGPPSSKGPAAEQRGPGGQVLRHEPGARPPDRRPATASVLDQIERAPVDDQDAGIAELVDRARSGDQLAFAELYVKFFDRVQRYLVVALKNADDAREAAQQVFLKLLETLPGHDPIREPFRHWLFQVVRNHALDMKRRARSSGFDGPDPNDAMVARMFDADQRRDGERVADLIAGLPDAQRRVLTLRYVFEFSASEIGDVLGVTPDAVRHTQMRALKTLSRRLAPEAPTRS
jgi:RNA polymerase sigma-70 factor (ECF subfamily)